MGRNFYYQWRKTPSDDFLSGFYTSRIRESEKLKTVLKCVQHGDSSEESRTWSSQIEHDGEKKYRAESTNQEFCQKRKLWKERRSQELGDKTAWTKNSGRLLAVESQRAVFQRRQLQFPSRYQKTCKNDTAESISELFYAAKRETRREPVPSGRMSRWPCKDYLKGTCTNPFCEKWHPPEWLFYKSESGCRFGEMCSYVHRQAEEQPRKRSKKNGDKSAVAMLKKNEHHHRAGRHVMNVFSSNTRQLGCVFQDVEPPKSSSILRKSSDIRKPIRCVKSTNAVVRHANIRDQNPSLGMICPGDAHQRNLNTPTFEDRSQEVTEWQERCAREAARRLAKHIQKVKEKPKTAFFSPSENRCLPAPSNLEPEEREFVVDSGASMHMTSKKRTWILLKFILWRSRVVLR